MKRILTYAGSVSVLLLLSAAYRAEQPAAVADPIDRLIRALGSEDFEAREAASKALKDRGAAALPALHEALDSPDPEISRRARELVEATEGPLAEKARALVEKHKGTITSVRDYYRREWFSVSIDGATGAELRLVKYLGSISTLSINGDELTDTELGALAGFAELKTVNLGGPSCQCGISNTALRGAVELAPGFIALACVQCGYSYVYLLDALLPNLPPGGSP